MPYIHQQTYKVATGVVKEEDDGVFTSFARMVRESSIVSTICG